MSICWPRTLSCSTAAGRCKSAATSSGRRPHLAEPQGELAAGGRFAGALEAAHHQDGRPVLEDRDLVIDRAHELDQLVEDDLDDLVGRVDASEHVLADGLGFDAGDEVVGDVEVDVGFEERPADFA